MKTPTQTTESTQCDNPKCTCVDCKCDPCECNGTSCCNKSDKLCSSSWCNWGSILRITLALLLIIAAFGLGVKFGTGHDRFDGRYGNNNGRYGKGEMQNNKRGEQAQNMNCSMMQGNMMNMNGTHDPMDMSMRDMGAMLAGKTGAELNRAFLEGMIPHHQGAVDMAKYLENSDKPELREMGQAIITAQNTEIEQMKQWMIDWGYTQTGTTQTGTMNMHIMPDGTMMHN